MRDASAGDGVAGEPSAGARFDGSASPFPREIEVTFQCNLGDFGLQRPGLRAGKRTLARWARAGMAAPIPEMSSPEADLERTLGVVLQQTWRGVAVVGVGMPHLRQRRLDRCPASEILGVPDRRCHRENQPYFNLRSQTMRPRHEESEFSFSPFPVDLL